MSRKERLPANVSSFVDRHGKRRWRWRKAGRSEYFAAHPNSPEGRAELAGFVAAATDPLVLSMAKGQRYAHGTVGWLAARWFASPAFTGRKRPATIANARRILEPFVAETAHDRLEHFRFDHVEALLARAALPRTVATAKGARRRGGVSAAANLRGELKPFFAYGFKLLGIEKPNPVDQAARIAVPRGGFHCWDEDEIARFRARHPLGGKPRLALEIFLWTAQRRGDASSFGHKHLSRGKVRYTQAKTGKTLWLPAAPQLTAAIAAMAVVGTETFLVTDYGKPFSVAGLGNKMRAWCDQAGLPHCSAHGLRKAAARRSAEHGGSNQQLKALGGWSGDAEVGLYTAAAEQERLAEQALAPVIAFDQGQKAPGAP